MSSLLPGLRPLLPWQKKPLGFIAGLDHAGIFMDKRLGKCAVAIRHALLNGAKRILISAPLSACPDWGDELVRDGQIYISLYGMTIQEREEAALGFWNSYENDPSPLFFLTNKDGLMISKGRQKVPCKTCDGNGAIDESFCPICDGTGKVKPKGKQKPQPSAVCMFPWDEVIWDESTNLKNPKSQINEVAQTCFRDCPHRLALSGEYAPEGWLDVFEQMRFIAGGRWMGHSNFWSWRDENFQQIGYDWLPKKGVVRAMRELIKTQAVTLSRKSAGVGEVKTFERVVVDLPPKIRKAYDHAEKYFELPPEAWEGAEASPETEYSVVVKSWLSQIAGGFPKHFPALHSDHKLDALTDICLGRYPSDKLVVTFRYNSELFAAHRALIGHKSVCATIIGATPPSERKDLQNAFQRGSLRVLLMQVKVAKFGIDLSAADTMVRYSLPDPYEEISQPMDRIVHPLKKKPLHYIDIQTRDTTDEDKWNAMGDKRDVARMFMRRTEEFMKLRLTKKYGEVPQALK